MNDRTNVGGAAEGVGKESVIYTHRFTETQEKTRALTWQILCAEFLQKFISPQDVVVDLGAGDGLFSRNIKAKKIIAVDLSPHVEKLRASGIEVHTVPATEFSAKISEPADVVFMSNFLEHLPSKKLLLEVLEECCRALKPGGRAIILQPNIRYVGRAYWDYVDHHIAITEHSLVEALEVTGYTVEKLIPRFLPYTAKSGLGSLVGGGSSWIIRTYLKLPILWRIFGQQTFVIARKR